MDWINIRGGIHWTENELANLLQVFFDIQTCSTRPATDENFFEAYKLCLQLFSKFPLPLMEITEHGIVRARRNYGQELFSHQFEISYKKQCPNLIGRGRFHRRGESMFYGSLPTIGKQSAFLITAAAETCKELFEDACNDPEFVFTVGLWKVRPFMAICLCFDPNHLVVDERMRQNIFEFKRSVINNCSRLSSEFILQCLSFFSELSSRKCNDEKIYAVLSAFFCAIRDIYAEEILHVEGIMYPSASTLCKGLNIVLTPDAVDNYLYLSQVTMFKFDRSKVNRKEFVAYPIADLIKPGNRLFRFCNIFDKRNTKELINFQFQL